MRLTHSWMSACLLVLLAGCQPDSIKPNGTLISEQRSGGVNINSSLPAPEIVNVDNVIHPAGTSTVSVSWTSSPTYSKFYVRVQDLSDNKTIVSNNNYLSTTISVPVFGGRSYSFTVNAATTAKNAKFSPEDQISFSVACHSGYESINGTCTKKHLSCVGASTQSCTINNGIGTQSRVCSNGVYSAFSSCLAISCNSGYVLSSNSCVAVVSNPGSELLQGNGFSAATIVPVPEITTGAGADAKVLAHWDVVPYQTFNGKINVGILAYHFNGIKKVDFSADNGPWVSVYLPTPNPQTAGKRPEQTAVEEYWVTLDAKNFRTGPVEIRAIAYPAGAGKPVVLQGPGSSGTSSLFLNADANSTLPREVRYTTKTGSDANDCKTQATACLTLKRAVVSAGRSLELDGAEIHIGEGSWKMPELGWAYGYNSHRWLTFSSIPGTNPEDVIITGVDGPGDSAGMALKLVHFKNMTFNGAVDKTPWGFDDYFWFDNVAFRNPKTDVPYDNLRIGNNFNPQGWAQVGVYHTDVYMDDMGNGPIGSILARNVFADHTGGGHASSSQTVINYTVNVVFGAYYPFIGGTGIDYHGDLYQFFSQTEDVILYGIRTTPGAWTSTRGIAGDNRNVAIVKSDMAVSGYVFSMCNVNHLIVQQSILKGASDWCSEGGTLDPLNIKDVLFDRSIFVNGHDDQLPHPTNLPGVKIKY